MHTKRHSSEFRSGVLIAGAILAMALSPLRAAEEHPLLPIMQSELDLSMKKMAASDGTKPYFIQYQVTDLETIGISASLGSITADNNTHARTLDVSVRCGDYGCDSTRQIRGNDFFGGREFSYGGMISLPLNDDPLATRHAIWLATDEKFKAAAKRLAQVKANLKVKVEEEDKADDFSREEPSVHIGPWIKQTCDRKLMAERMRKFSKRFRDHPEIYESGVSLMANVGNRLAVNSEGSKLQFGEGFWRIGIQASTIAEDGMELWQYKAFDACAPDRLPGDDEVLKAVDQVIEDIRALRKAPIVEPYTGPAILMNRASGVFFHEIFGHRIEGHRQKDVEEGQTFAKKIGKEVLPVFLSVVDDPSQRRFKNIDLNGFYEFDEECVPAGPAKLVEDGILKTFLMSRSPTRGVTKSNGHGRAQAGMGVVARQGNLIVDSAKRVSYDKLREELIDLVKKQKKEYGLLFKDISGGFTMTQRFMPQAFKVVPILVYKVYPDGRADELVRGVDIVGTPLTCFSKIVDTADDDDVFNGYCGAESGMVPVAAISPSILVEQIEIEKKQKAQDRPPIMEAPIASEKSSEQQAKQSSDKTPEGGDQ